jgi:heme-degrading monooxygenase HmoA
MTGNNPTRHSQPIYRVDKFIVPAHARAEFLDRVAKTQALLREQEGFVQGFVLEKQSGPGSFNFVTFVEWARADAIERAAAEVAKLHAKLGFDRQELVSRLGITADIALYEPLDL